MGDKMLGFSSFLWVALCCVFLASWAPTSAHAAAEAITWAYSAQTVTMLTTDTLTISWIGYHDVYYSTTGTCSGGTSKATSSSYTTKSGDMDVGTHYFYCSIGSHCSSGMYVTVNVIDDNPCDTREWFYVSAYLQCRLYCFRHEFVYFGHFDRRDMFGQSLRRVGAASKWCRG